MQDIIVTEERNRHEIPEMILEKESFSGESVTVTLWMEPSMAFRVYDEFSPEQVEKQPDGGFRITFDFPKGEWPVSYTHLDVYKRQPQSLRQTARRRLPFYR